MAGECLASPSFDGSASTPLRTKFVHFGITGCSGGLDGLNLDERLALIEEAEWLGFESIWLNEEHFVNEDRLCLSPIPLLSYLAGRTERLRLGFSVLQLPFHNPLRLAEDIATLDVLSRGRVEFGISRSGNEVYHRGFGIPSSERTERFDEGLECIETFWHAEEPVSHHGKFWNFDRVVISPPPYQRPHPPIHIGARNHDSVKRVARGGYLLIEGVVQAITYTRTDIAAFREGAAEAGRTVGPADISIGRYVFVAETDSRAIEESRPVIAGVAEGMLTSPHLALGFVLDKEHLELERFTREFAIVGSPDTVAARIEKLHEELGFGRFNCGFGLTGRATPDQVFRSLRLFGKEVIPALAGS